MDFLQAVILGIVEGVTEFLPISSTGHLILTSYALGIPETAFLKSFEIAIQLGAIGAVVALYRRTIFFDRASMARVAVAFLPAMIVGFAFYRVIKETLLGNELVVMGALFLGGVLLIIFELLHREREDAVQNISTLPYRTAALIGLFQALAVVPGVSRSGATIIGGLFLNLRRTTIVEFSFLLAVPTMLAATGYDLLNNYGSFSSDQIGVLAVGFVTSFVVAVFAVKFLLQFIKHHTFITFGVYRILAAFFFWWVVW